jgi:hypothetical protein
MNFFEKCDIKSMISTRKQRMNKNKNMTSTSNFDFWKHLNMAWPYDNMYLCTGFGQNTLAEYTSGYIVGTYIISD